MLKAFSTENFPSPSKNGPKMAVLGQKGVYSLTLVLRPPKGTSLRGSASFDVFCVKIRAGVLAVDYLKNPPKNEQIAE